ncbi:hypothetical protein RhiirA5_477181 [Rhizophagus irregularis]|uniref:Uncharacterized protein n=1 Tax=Rhizophagus irregularis TaxID=588596 RepID=A0A2N0RPC9_9GLOM|nr:hypothetical protein RhiirA5_477181 [Rhizophagus irregularis]PKC65145.1 hypothetical protein RhiirA1_395513 [Rhizophagus irregularis]PKK73983.1 hypothetical protein RhiirC2_847218 [Rhizophagus irregularis]UZO10651.1 hypothetical protein OCT59_002231 [Rhizophagus irregularis]CAB4420760.1 unnamed protein product [Rhizophagus irregularis]
MSETQFPRSLFPQFTEAQLEEISKRFKSSVNWTKYNKWVEDGEPFVEHDEIIDQNGSSPRSPDGTKQCNVDRNRGLRNGSSSLNSARKTNQKTRERSNGTPSPARTQTTACDEREYCGKNSGPSKLSDSFKLRTSNDSRPTKR